MDMFNVEFESELLKLSDSDYIRSAVGSNGVCVMARLLCATRLYIEPS